jgi:hypothetical protein
MKTLRKWPQAKNEDVMELFEEQFDKLCRLQVLLSNANDEVSLNLIFAENLMTVMTSDHKLSLVKEKTSSESNEPTQELQNETSKLKLTKIIFYMLNMITIADMSEFVVELLVASNFIEQNEDGHSLTVDGFRFILQDVSSQIHILLLNYVRLKKSSPLHLKLLFQLILSNKSSYKVNEENSVVDQDTVIQILMELKQIGLVYMKKKKRFYITQLMRSFLLGDDTLAASKSLMSQDEDKSIVVETNFRVY